MTESKIQEISARELCSVAYHEAGHAVVIASECGIPAKCVVWENFGASSDEKAWRGRTMHFDSVPEEKKPLIALAGVISEIVFEGESDPGSIQAELTERWEDPYLYGVSETDLLLAGPEWSSNIVDAINVCLRNWQAIADTAFQLQSLIEQGKPASITVRP